MRVEDLVIGKEYYLDSSKIDKGIFRGKNKEGSVFYEPTTKTGYIIETNNKNGFIGCVGFSYPTSETPVEP